MDEETFLQRLSDWEAMPDGTDLEDGGLWVAKCEVLCALFLEVTPAHRHAIPAFVDPYYSLQSIPHVPTWAKLNEVVAFRVWAHVFFMREVSQRIKSPADIYPLRLGLASAAIVGTGMDFRDSLVSLAFLHHASTEAGIDPKPHFREIADMAQPDTGKFILDFLKRGKRDIKSMLEAFS